MLHCLNSKVLPGAKGEPPAFQFVLSCHWVQLKRAIPLCTLTLSIYIRWEYPPSCPEWTVLSAIPSRRCAPVPLSSLWALVGLFQYSHLSFIQKSPNLDIALQVWPQRWWGERKDYLPSHTGNTLPDANQDAISLLCFRDILLDKFYLLSNRNLKSCFSRLLYI